LANGSLELSQALEGVHLNFVTALYDPAWFDEPVGNSDPTLMTGFHVDLARLLAHHGQFTYTITSVPTSSFAPNLTWTEYLEASTQRFDVNLDWWLATEERAILGLQPPLAFLDLSLVPTVEGEIEEATMWDNFGSFARPIAPSLWLTFLGISLVTAVIYYIFEKDYSNDTWDRHDKTRKKMLNSLFLALTSYTGSQPFTPGTNTGKMLSLTYSFFILLLVSGYTANLAVFLVIEQSVTVCESFETCVNDGRSVCVMKGTELDHWLTDSYGYLDTARRIVRADVSPWPGLVSGECDIVVDSYIGYEIAKVRKDYNTDCTLSRSGESALQHYGGGWMSRTDYLQGCTSVLRDALAVHMLRLSSSGEIQDLLDAFVASQQTQICTDTSESDISKSATSLEWYTMLGPIVIHVIGIVVAFVFYLTRSVKQRRKNSKDCLASDDEHVTSMARHMAHMREQLDKLAIDLGREPGPTREPSSSSQKSVSNEPSPQPVPSPRTVPHINLVHSGSWGSDARRHSVTMQPGPLRLSMINSTGRVTDVSPGGQAAEKGIRPGWRLVSLDGEPYKESLVHSKIASGEPFEIIFSEEDVDLTARSQI
jgi:hypothetical protein